MRFSTLNISITICSYNKKEILRETLKRLLEDKEKEDEIIVVDDGSDDGSQRMLDNMNFENFKTVFREDKGYRLASARNIALRNASYEPILQIDDDDWLEGDISDLKGLYKAERLVTLRRDCVEGGQIRKDERLLSYDSQKKMLRKKLYLLAGTAEDGVERTGLVWGPILFSKETAQGVGNYEEEYDGHWGREDTDFASRFYLAGYPIFYYAGEAFVHQDHKKHTDWKQERNINDYLLQYKLNCYKEKEKFQNFSFPFNEPRNPI